MKMDAHGKLQADELPLLDEAGPALSVTDYTHRIKALLERTIRPSWVCGEISNLRTQASGHIYFSLKDQKAQLSAVLFRGDAVRQPVKLRDGIQVVVFGEISVYEARGNYQFIVRAVVENGTGRLQREFEALKHRLATDGLFDPTRKRRLPPMPHTVGFITSPSGAALQDFLRILRRRGWRGRIVILPAKVQGTDAATEMVNMLNAAARLNLFDLLVIGRGGGSIEDLWAFNEEPLVRAIAACPIPIISAVGHEIDFTLCDFAADLRAETPSAAAELISSSFVAATERVQRLRDNLHQPLASTLGTASSRLAHAHSRLRLLSPSTQIERGFLRLDDLANRLTASLSHSLQNHRQDLQHTASLLRERTPARRVEIESHRLLGLWKRLQAASPASVLNRGFVILRDASGQPLIRRTDLAPDTTLSAQFADGTARLRTADD